jgi:hypothetical protein
MMQFFRKNVKWIMLVIVVLFVVSCFAGYGMYSGGSGIAGAGAANYPVARIGGERVLLSQIERDVAQFIQSSGMGQNITSEDYPALRTNILDQMAILKELDKEVKARNISVAKDEIESNIKNIEASFPTKEIFLQQMQAAGMDERKLRQNIEESLLRQKVFEQVTSGVSADAQEIRGFYDTMKSYAFQKPEGFKVNIAHFKTEETAEKARSSIERGNSWDSAIDEVSADVIDSSPYASPILVGLTQLTGEVEFLKNQPMNKISKVVKLNDGDFMIVIKRSKEAAGTAAFDEVSADVEQMVLGQKRQTLQTEFLRGLREKAVIEILDPSIFSNPEPEAVGGAAGGSTDENTSGDVLKKSSSGDIVKSEDIKSDDTK